METESNDFEGACVATFSNKPHPSGSTLVATLLSQYVINSTDVYGNITQLPQIAFLCFDILPKSIFLLEMGTTYTYNVTSQFSFASYTSVVDSSQYSNDPQGDSVSNNIDSVEGMSFLVSITPF
eukprot:TRINITY_DN1028_c0_g2_i1.p1 TRINITY_DN1028_c0_g2~~TRINITY_DN1028_c0_g2_i1.p1  ORF type:complete len:124 (+),score=18.19 TRINITY_DN1028_c0_g2_i1:380-751(+)